MPGPQSPHPIPDATSTAELITRVQRGDDEAYARLMDSFAPLLRRWAHGRLSDRARGAVETEDLVQETLLAVHRKMDTIEAAHPGAFWLYLRRTIQRRLANAGRDATRRPSADVDAEKLDLPSDADPDLFDYERALAKLSDEQRAIVILRLEFGLSHQESATALGLPSADAARMRTARAVATLAEYMS